MMRKHLQLQDASVAPNQFQSIKSYMYLQIVATPGLSNIKVQVVLTRRQLSPCCSSIVAAKT